MMNILMIILLLAPDRFSWKKVYLNRTKCLIVWFGQTRNAPVLYAACLLAFMRNNPALSISVGVTAAGFVSNMPVSCLSREY